jgi:flagellar biosynthesis protein FlhG
MTTVIPVASGKGGVGKTVCTANLGVALAQAGKTVILIDLDLGGSNLHTCLGVRNNRSGVGNYILKQEQSLESLLVETSERRLFFIPGDSLLPGSANLPYFRKQMILKEVPNLVADFVLVDLGAGSAFNTIDFFLSSNGGLMVIVPETTSILNAYSFIKSALFRLLYRSFPNRSAERQLITDFSQGRLEQSEEKLGALADRMARISEQSASLVRDRLNAFVPRIIMNMGKQTGDVNIGAKLRQIVRRNLEIDVQYVGFVPHDPSVSRSIIERQPAITVNPASRFAHAIRAVAEKLVLSPTPAAAELYTDEQDLMDIGRIASKLYG